MREPVDLVRGTMFRQLASEPQNGKHPVGIASGLVVENMICGLLI
jgi:hypothetical protein